MLTQVDANLNKTMEVSPWRLQNDQSPKFCLIPEINPPFIKGILVSLSKLLSKFIQLLVLLNIFKSYPPDRPWGVRANRRPADIELSAA